MALIKDMYSVAFYNRFAGVLQQVLPAFDGQQFKSAIFTPAFAHMEWKQRMKHTTQVLHSVMPPVFTRAVPVIGKSIQALRNSGVADNGLAYIFYADYIETYGLEDVEASIKALKLVTQFVSCEFAVRPFIIRYPQRMMQQMLLWSKHRNEAVRRLASEGSRPRLPWGMALPALKQDPTPILPILENLKQDPSETVRRSVANNLNDIAKDNPQVVLQLAKSWKGISPETDALIKHGSRTLLKQGHAEILQHFGLNSKGLELTGFTVLTSQVQIGGELLFGCTVRNTTAKPQTVRLEYGIYYLRANGTLSRKVFKISERLYAPRETCKVVKKHSFRVITTKVYYAGQQAVSIIVNGVEKDKAYFVLQA
jgi:3-methyladenine DNA glycosylase AlkC